MITLALPRYSWLISALLIALLTVGYIFQVVQSTKAGFYISNYEKQITEFIQENKLLESDFSSLNSLANLENILDDLNYEKVERIHYLRVPGSMVVAK